MTTQTILPSVDGAMKVDNITNLWNMELAKNTKAIFQYNGPETPEAVQLVSDIRQRFQELQEYIAIILADLPA